MTELTIIELGSNINPEHHLPRAIGKIRMLGTIVEISKVYKTDPFGPPDQPPFINAALALLTELSPLELRQELRKIEAELGRERSQDKYKPRRIDLDLCLYGQQIIEKDNLIIPDPNILERPYLARTIAEIAPELIHPIVKEPISSIANRLDPDFSLKEDVNLTRSSHQAWQKP